MAYVFQKNLFLRGSGTVEITPVSYEKLTNFMIFFQLTCVQAESMVGRKWAEEQVVISAPMLAASK